MDYSIENHVVETPMNHEQSMRAAVRCGWEGVEAGQSPFAAAIVDDQGDLLVLDHNRVKELIDPSAHAEVIAIRSACKKLGQQDLSGFTLVSTCEPCPMCAATIVLAGVGTVIYGASVKDAIEAGFSELQIPCELLFSHAESEIRVLGGVLRDSCRELLMSTKSRG